MREFIILLVHSIATLVQLAKPGGVRSVVAESVLVRHQLLVLNRGRKRAPNLRPADRIIAGLCTCPWRIRKLAEMRWFVRCWRGGTFRCDKAAVTLLRNCYGRMRPCA